MRERVVIAPVAEDPEHLDRLVEAARRRGFSGFALPSGTAAGSWAAEAELWTLHGDLISPAGAPPGRSPVRVEEVAGPEDLDRALRRAAPGSAIALTWASDRMIPLENALAARPPGLTLWAVVDRPSQLPGTLGALEHGADRALVRVRSLEELAELEARLEPSDPAPLPWEFLPVTRVEPVGLGDRVLVDTTSLLAPLEGLLVGSSAALLFHVASEAVGSRFSRPRPFRVNAGAAHSYLLMADGTTRYLSELAAGDAVRTAQPNGPGRTARVGRVKVERRPLVLVAVEREGRPRTVFLQEAETVRLSTADGPVATTALRPGARVAVAALPPARHLGVVVDETIEER